MFLYFLFLLFIAFTSGRYYVVKGQHLVGNNFGYKISILFIIIISSFRFNIGYDWSQYLLFIYPTFNIDALPRHEPLNRYIYIIAGSLQQPWILFTSYAIITYALIGKTISDYSCAKYESLMIYICLFFLPGLSIIRQDTAVAIVFYGYRFIKEKKPIKYFVVCLLAMCFHKSAIIALLLYPLYYLNLYISIFSVSTFVVIFKLVLPKVVESFFPSFMAYLNTGLASASGNFQKLFYLFLFVYTFLLNKKKKNIGFLNICIIGCILPFILGGHTGGRLGEYFLIYFALLIPECNKRFKIEYRVLFLIPFYIYFFLYLLVSVKVNQSNEYVPYRWYFLESLDQELE